MTASAPPAATDSGLDDAELIRRSLADPAGFAALFDRYAAAIHHYAARRLGTAAADAIGAVAGIYPAVRAARLSPTTPSASRPRR